MPEDVEDAFQKYILELKQNLGIYPREDPFSSFGRAYTNFNIIYDKWNETKIPRKNRKPLE
jgi:hypothetical protein